MLEPPAPSSQQMQMLSSFLRLRKYHCWCPSRESAARPVNVCEAESERVQAEGPCSWRTPRLHAVHWDSFVPRVSRREPGWGPRARAWLQGLGREAPTRLGRPLSVCAAAGVPGPGPQPGLGPPCSFAGPHTPAILLKLVRLQIIFNNPLPSGERQRGEKVRLCQYVKRQSGKIKETMAR